MTNKKRCIGCGKEKAHYFFVRYNNVHTKCNECVGYGDKPNITKNREEKNE